MGKNHICVVEGCGRTGWIDIQKTHYCNGHGNRLRKYGDPLAGPPIRAYAQETILMPMRGGKLVYRRRWIPGHPTANCDGYALDHRYVAWEHGILTEENFHFDVHHINGDTQDNRIDNLEVIEHREHWYRHLEEDGVINQYGHWPLRNIS